MSIAIVAMSSFKNEELYSDHLSDSVVLFEDGVFTVLAYIIVSNLIETIKCANS